MNKKQREDLKYKEETLKDIQNYMVNRHDELVEDPDALKMLKRAEKRLLEDISKLKEE